MDNWIISFGPFRVTRSRRLLERDGEPIHIGSRAFDILARLLEHPGQVVSHRALLEAAWPGLSVDDGNLRFQMTALRKGLAGIESNSIINVPGRGYCFVAPISRSDEIVVPQMPPRMLTERIAPPPPTKLFGRDEVVVEISNLVRARRAVTLVGPGGMGKTSVALAVASRLENTFRDRVCLVEFASVEDPTRVAETLAVALGLPARNEDSIGDIVSMLKSRQMLLIVDGCEHVIDSVAVLLDKIVTATTNISALATSREALRIEGEWVFQLRALASPPTNKGLSVAEILLHPAAQLFVERAGVAKGAISSAGEADLIARICSQLDGLALAIELAASQAQVFGLEELARMLENGLSPTWPGRRTAPPRHQTLGAMLDWSYRLLSEAERIVLRSISVFSGQFSLEEASVVASNGMVGVDTSLALAGLVSKSLLFVSRTDKGTLYRLLDTTKTYAREKLGEAGETDAARRRHAAFCLQSFEGRYADGTDPRPRVP